MGRLVGFDYRRPFYYMVTIKALPGIGVFPFSEISSKGTIVPNAITLAFMRTIEEWSSFWASIERVSPYVIMPDHLHLLVKLAAVENAVSLGVVVGQLKKQLRNAYWRTLGAPTRPLQDMGIASGASAPLKNGNSRHATRYPEIFAEDFHDWIVKRRGQLEAFRKYILENPMRAARRRANRQFFTMVRGIIFQGRQYTALGNEALLDLPMIVAIKGHRHAPSAEATDRKLHREGLLAMVSRIGPGGAGLSTFLSPLEKEAGNSIIQAGGSLIVLSMNGFDQHWHPSEKQEHLCAEGRMLYLSPYPPQAAKLSRQEMYQRAHALVDWAIEHSQEYLEAWP